MGSPYCPRCGDRQPCDLEWYGAPCPRRHDLSPGTTHDELVLASWLAGTRGRDADARTLAWAEACAAGAPIDLGGAP